MNQLKTFNPNNQAVAFGVKRKYQVTLEDLMDEIKLIKTDITSVKTDIKSINVRLDNIVNKNHLIE